MFREVRSGPSTVSTLVNIFTALNVFLSELHSISYLVFAGKRIALVPYKNYHWRHTVFNLSIRIDRP